VALTSDSGRPQAFPLSKIDRQWCSGRYFQADQVGQALRRQRPRKTEPDAGNGQVRHDPYGAEQQAVR
jgi:hypothetical protein